MVTAVEGLSVYDVHHSANGNAQENPLREMVGDQETVVIGGLIRDDSRITETGVPCLADIPGLGWLFKAKGDSGDKTNLLILLNPTIIKNPAHLREITAQRFKQVQEAREKFEKNRLKIGRDRDKKKEKEADKEKQKSEEESK